MIKELLHPTGLLDAPAGSYRILSYNAQFVSSWGNLVSCLNRQLRLNKGDSELVCAQLDLKLKPPEISVIVPLSEVGPLSDDVQYWLLFLQMDSIPNGEHFEYPCNSSVASRLRNAFSNSGITASITISVRGFRFLKGKRATKMQSITELMKSAVGSGDVFVSCEPKEVPTFRSRVSSLQAIFPGYSFSVVAAATGIFIRAKSMRRADRAKEFREWSKALGDRVNNCEEITDVQSQCDRLREILTGSPDAPGELV